MDHELWSQLSHAMFDVARSFPHQARWTYDTHCIVRVYLWAVIHDRPVDWATRPRSWSPQTRPADLPDQSTMSRRLRHPETAEFMRKLEQRLGGGCEQGLLKYIDGKPLSVPRHTHDPDATSGRGVGGMAKGYKLHAIWGQGFIPIAWTVCPLNVSEKVQAKALIPHMQGAGYLLADSYFDSGPLYDLAARQHHQMLAPRAQAGAGLGHRRQSIHRLRSIHLLENIFSDFGRDLYNNRKAIERSFAGLVSFGGGLQSLPPWVRTLFRVRLFVHAKILINACRLRRLRA